jgi:ABC-type multidrug transport system fused ATPase/permease subunit
MKLFLNCFQFFYRIIGNKIYTSWLLLLFATIFEGIGISLFFPLLRNGTTGDDMISEMILLFLNYFNLSYSITLMLQLILIVLFFRAVLAISQGLYNAWLMSSMGASLQLQILKGYFESNYTYYLSQRSGYMVNAVARELPLITAAYKMFSSILSSIVIAAVYLSIPLMLNPQVTLFLLVFGGFMFVVMIPINRFLKRSSLRYSDISGALQNYVIQSLSFYKYLKSTNTFSTILNKIEKTVEETRRIMYLQAGPFNAFPHYGIEFISFMAIVGMIYYQSVLSGKNLESQLFVLFLLYRAISTLLSLQMQYRKLVAYSGSIRVYNNLKSGININQEIINKNNLSANFNNNISLQNVSFKYDTANSMTLDEINMVIEAKSTIGIAGESGSGKSTLMSLITATLKPKNGVLKIGEHAYDDLNILDIRSNIGYVTQENIIFNDTIYNNISLWDQNVSMSKVEDSAKMALAYDFINEQPKKFEQQLGDNGVNLSGGQRQRITIARELYKNSEIIIFDEATSALDSESEKQIQRSIHKLKGKKTILIIAHRLFTLKECDIIYFFKKGKITASGTFDALLKSSDEFKRMCTTQNLKKEVDN